MQGRQVVAAFGVRAMEQCNLVVSQPALVGIPIYHCLYCVTLGK